MAERVNFEFRLRDLLTPKLRKIQRGFNNLNRTTILINRNLKEMSNSLSLVGVNQRRAFDTAHIEGYNNAVRRTTANVRALARANAGATVGATTTRRTTTTRGGGGIGFLPFTTGTALAYGGYSLGRSIIQTIAEHEMGGVQMGVLYGKSVGMSVYRNLLKKAAETPYQVTDYIRGTMQLRQGMKVLQVKLTQLKPI